MWLRSLVLALAITFMGAQHGFSEERLRFGFVHWPPFGMTDQQPYSGIMADVAHEAAARMGVELDFVSCPFKRCLKMMEDGDLDLLSGVARNTEREQYLDYVPTPFHSVSVVFHVRKGEARILRRYEDLSRLRVGMVAKSHYFERFNDDESLDKTEVHEEQRLPEMLVNHRIDAYIGTNPNAAYERKLLGYSEVIEPAVYAPGYDVPVHFAFSKRSAYRDRVAVLDSHIADMLSDGTLTNILDGYR